MTSQRAGQAFEGGPELHAILPGIPWRPPFSFSSIDADRIHIPQFSPADVWKPGPDLFQDLRRHE